MFFDPKKYKVLHLIMLALFLLSSCSLHNKKRKYSSENKIVHFPDSEHPSTITSHFAIVESAPEDTNNQYKPSQEYILITTYIHKNEDPNKVYLRHCKPNKALKHHITKEKINLHDVKIEELMQNCTGQLYIGRSSGYTFDEILEIINVIPLIKNSLCSSNFSQFCIGLITLAGFAGGLIYKIVQVNTNLAAQILLILATLSLSYLLTASFVEYKGHQELEMEQIETYLEKVQDIGTLPTNIMLTTNIKTTIKMLKYTFSEYKRLTKNIKKRTR